MDGKIKVGMYKLGYENNLKKVKDSSPVQSTNAN